MTCKHGSTSVVCPECDLDVIERDKIAEEDFDRMVDTHNNRIMDEVAKENKAESSIVVTSGRNVTEMIEQPKPKFTLVDLEQALDNIYAQLRPSGDSINTGNARAIVHELIATISRIKTDLDSIDMPSDNNQAISDAINTEKSEFSVCGVQLIEHKKIAGVSLYTTVSKARKIRDILNSHYAQQRVDFEAKIVNYPVY